MCIFQSTLSFTKTKLYNQRTGEQLIITSNTGEKFGKVQLNNKNEKLDMSIVQNNKMKTREYKMRSEQE